MGCGAGALAACLASLGYTVNAVDFADSAIAQAREEHAAVQRVPWPTSAGSGWSGWRRTGWASWCSADLPHRHPGKREAADRPRRADRRSSCGARPAVSLPSPVTHNFPASVAP
ncbi:methyltransferase domain-containing protein [Streptomyces sp. JJ38]|uniref:methyltransferase domain-containing protein n=1 Tax=Streptomyces sp. JJ38 TaxID=2738128 RepID=UPI0027E16553|nr:methyltransferase domain-containing protein [Streptomyces sp. JJ38]